MTPAQLKAEIESGPLALECEPFWADVFDDPEPLRTKLAFRQGTLKPDAVYGLLKVLNNPSFATKQATTVSRGAFIAMIAPLSFTLTALPSSPETNTIKDAWRDVFTLLTGGDDEVNISRAQIGSLMDLAISHGLLTTQQKEAIIASGGSVPQSRLQQLGWTVTDVDLQAAKAVA